MFRCQGQQSILGKPFVRPAVVALLCWKYPYPPRKVRFTSVMMACRLRPANREVIVRTRSFSFLRLFFRGHFMPHSK
jgi:hypothetical protein